MSCFWFKLQQTCTFLVLFDIMELASRIQGLLDLGENVLIRRPGLGVLNRFVDNAFDIVWHDVFARAEETFSAGIADLRCAVLDVYLDEPVTPSELDEMDDATFLAKLEVATLSVPTGRTVAVSLK